MTSTRRLLVGALTVAALVGAVTFANAATLPLNGGVLSSATVNRPCPGTAQAVPSAPHSNGNGNSDKYDDVTVKLPAGCSGFLQVTVTEDAAVLGSFERTVTSPGGMVEFKDVKNGGYRPKSVSVVATLAGWNLPVTWSYTPPAVGLTATCSTTDTNATCAADVGLRDSWAGGYNLDITVRDTRTIGDTLQYAWTVVINFSSAGYPFVPNAIDGSGVVTASTCAQRPNLTFTGMTSWGTHHLLGKGETRTFWIQPRSSGTGSVLTCP